MVRRMMLMVVVICVLSRAGLAATTEGKEPHYWSDAGYGVVAVLANLVYMPVKVVYATLGTVTGGFAYVMTVGDTDTAQKIWSPSLGGSYVITPGMLTGDEEILFNGPSYSSD
jgi:hypothetical protein